ncbi:MAG: ATPase associated with various cellular family protein [Amycolatopsis sp.]|uniref:ATP-binding protein n=1 Tax=Amycolatopsis sp. TaxID=37632 RepID=UPI0026398413|nr:ATP-binding protein [Amycolatopsis sp.]MCU1682725.1 ATPase associated with various cellular family protein [Amycolatopsis sp.]
MNAAQDWETVNGRFLTASLEWLRLLLRLDADEERLAAAEDAIREAEACSPPPALVQLARQLGLSRFERDTLLLCASVELDPSIAELCARAHGNELTPYPTFGLAMSILPEAAWEIVAPQRGLRGWRLVEVTARPGQGLIASALRADERIVNYLKGLNYLDDRLAPLLAPLEPVVGIDLPPSQQSVVDGILAADGLVVQLAGPDEVSKQLVAAHAAEERGLSALRLAITALPTHPAELDDLARLWQREALLLPLSLYLDAGDADDSDHHRSAAARFLGKVGGSAVFAARESWSDVGRRSLVLDVEPPTPAERVPAWCAALGPGAETADVDSLAAQFALEVPAIAQIGVSSGGDAAEAWKACRARTRPRMDSLAQRLEPKVDWDDLVLSPAADGLLRRIAEQVPQRTTVYETWGFGDRATRGLGVSVLFAGPSGVGKTMAAEVLARRLNLDLYRIDLSAVVDKYIGETEKNLRRLFDAAETGGAILFFDEADSLFGKRTEVKDSHDRYANIETNFLLQRMEQYRGLAILATNMRSALDTAFLRRLRFVVDFTFPGPAERRVLWEKAFPERAPRGELDFDRLAQLQTNGGMTRNIVLNAAFLAASRGSAITMPIVLDAARAEFEKLEMPVRAKDFAWEAGGSS